MGTYQNPPNNPPLTFNSKKDQFQSEFVQRIKDTPFSYSQLYSINPPIFIDSIGTKLSQLLHPRMSTQQFFPPQQAIKIIDCVLSGLVQLQQNGYQAHGDICSETIYYDKRQKIFKITHPIFSKISGFQLTSKALRFSFLSPEQLLILTDQSQPEQNVLNKISLKSDLFTFGILMCELCTLTSSNDIYCPDTYNIFDLEIKNRLEMIRQFYGGPQNAENCNIIISMIRQLLQYDEVNRKSPIQMKKYLQNLKSRANTSYRQPINEANRMKYVSPQKIGYQPY